MNYLWPAMIIFALFYAAFSGNIEEAAAAGLNAARDSVTVVLSFAGLICFWSGFLEIAERSGISEKLQSLLYPLAHTLFPRLKKGSRALILITENITANLLGMGNAATPAGIAAMQELDLLNPEPLHPTDEMCYFIVINTASMQLIPTTVISLRASHGASNPAAILLPVWICSFLSLSFSLLAMKLILSFEKSGRGRLP